MLEFLLSSSTGAALFLERNDMKPEALRSNTEKLLADNYSIKADEKIEKWRAVRDAGELVVIWSCSDARLILPDMAYHIRTISATGPRSPWHGAFNYGKVQGIGIMDHFDCGGLKTKESLTEVEEEGEGALAFVRTHVWHTDPVYQSILTASWTASRTHKQVLAVVQDHQEGSLYVQGAFNNADQVEYKTIPAHLLMSKYIEEDIYKNGRPRLRKNLIPSTFKPCLNEITEKVKNLKNKYPEFKLMQAVQRPSFVGLSTITKPLSVRFPTMFGEPGVIFQVSISRQSLEDDVDLENKDVKAALDQAHYPLTHCIHNQGFPDTSFENTMVLYIETGKMEISKRIAGQALRRDWVRNFLDLPGREMIIAEVIAGRIQKIDRAA